MTNDSLDYTKEKMNTNMYEKRKLLRKQGKGTQEHKEESQGGLPTPLLVLAKTGSKDGSVTLSEVMEQIFPERINKLGTFVWKKKDEVTLD